MLTGLAHGLDMLEVLAKTRKPMALGAIAAAVGMSKPGTHRVLDTLCTRGFVVWAEGGFYSLGSKTWELGLAVPVMQFVPLAIPVMQRMADRMGDGAILGALDVGFEVVYLHVIESREPVRVYTDTGSRLPPHVTSTGLACLAWLPPERLREILPKVLLERTPETMTSRDELLRELGLIRERGYAATLGTYQTDIGGVAAPVFGPGGAVIAALCVSSPRYRIDAAWNKRMPKAVVTAANEITRLAQSADQLEIKVAA